jgi:hypothetical protein
MLSEASAVDQLVSEVALIRRQLDDLCAKVDRIYDLLQGAALPQGPASPDGLHSDSAHSRQTATGAAPSTVGEDWVGRLAAQARELGLDISDETVQRLVSGPAARKGRAHGQTDARDKGDV